MLDCTLFYIDISDTSMRHPEFTPLAALTALPRWHLTKVSADHAITRFFAQSDKEIDQRADNRAHGATYRVTEIGVSDLNTPADLLELLNYRPESEEDSEVPEAA